MTSESPSAASLDGKRFAGYAWLVPFVEDGREFFLKTIIPSRKATRIYLSKDRYT